MQTDNVGLNEQIDGHTLLALLETRLVPWLFARKLAHDVIRVWVPGCQTGDMAYAVASLLYAHVLQRNDRPHIQVFATDGDPAAITAARSRQLPGRVVSATSPEWRGYAFEDGLWQGQITPAVRNLITFAQHQLLRDPPFINLDLIICGERGVAFVLDEMAQLLRMFHWCLRPNGYLLLNTQLDDPELSRLFVAVDNAPALFQRRSIAASFEDRTLYPAQGEQSWAPEPLQVVNHHLQAMNSALRRKVVELERANNDLNNLMSTTNLATVFLDRTLRIMRFTPPAQALFNIIPADHGRPLAHITHQLDYDQLISDATNVLMSLQISEREVRAADDRWYILRLIPYRTTDERIDGVVLICLDITERRAAEAEARHAYDQLELRVQERTQELRQANSQLQVEIGERIRLERERSELLRTMVLTQEEERRHIARELHDDLGQSVSALGMGLRLLADPALGAQKHEQILARVQQITIQIDSDMSRLAMDLRPSALDDLGLIAALQHYIDRWADHSDVQAEFQANLLEETRLPRELESVMYRVVQEALTNVLKHAHAHSVSVILEQRHDQVRVIIEDDGRGFDLETLQQVQNVRQRLGLLGMRERVALLGGMVTIETAPGTGTTLFVQLPIPPQALEEAISAP